MGSQGFIPDAWSTTEEQSVESRAQPQHAPIASALPWVTSLSAFVLAAVAGGWFWWRKHQASDDMLARLEMGATTTELTDQPKFAVTAFSSEKTTDDADSGNADLGRRSSALALIGGTFAAALPLAEPAFANVQPKATKPGEGVRDTLKQMRGDDLDFSFASSLDKKFESAQVTCKTRMEGEQRIFCLEKEVNDKNRAEAEAKGEKYTDQKGALSKGSYGV